MTLRHLSVACCAAVLMAASATTARADDWDDCRTEVPDKVMAGCTAVIEQHALKDEDLATAHRRRGNWYSRREMLDRAMADFESAVRLAPASADALIDRGSVHRRRGNLDQALADNARALELDPKNSSAFLQRANLRAARNEW